MLRLPESTLQFPTLTALALCMGMCSGSMALAQNEPTTMPPEHIPERQRPVAIVIHGGAGTIERKNLTEERESGIRDALEQAALAGHEILAQGGDSTEAVVAAITRLEDSHWFNAGKGAVFTHAGHNELDASIMEGDDRSAGAVAGVTGIKNPINLAVDVMRNSPHVMLSGTGAEAFAASLGYERMPAEYFHTDFRWQQLQQAKAGRSAQTEFNDQWYSTVGAVALDRSGNITAGTSTGGTANKRWGRIGDSPVIGAGTYAENGVCGISATGHGEYFIRAAVAHEICARVKHGGESFLNAAEGVVLEELVAMGGDGGIIGLGANGEVAMVFNTPGMYRAAIDTSGQLTVAIYGDEGEKMDAE